MTLQASGAITMAQINAEFGRGNNLNSYRGTSWYTDAGGSGTFSSGALSMSDFYSKRLTAPISYQNPLAMQAEYSGAGDLTYAGVEFSINPDGSWTVDDQLNGLLDNGDWVIPNATNFGVGKYFKATLNSTNGSSGGTTWTTTTSWLQLNATRQLIVTASTATTIRTRQANYTVQIATDSAGTNVVSTTTFSLFASTG